MPQQFLFVGFQLFLKAIVGTNAWAPLIDPFSGFFQRFIVSRHDIREHRRGTAVTHVNKERKWLTNDLPARHTSSAMYQHGAILLLAVVNELIHLFKVLSNVLCLVVFDFDTFVSHFSVKGQLMHARHTHDMRDAQPLKFTPILRCSNRA